MLLGTKVAFDLFSGTPIDYLKKQRRNVKTVQVQDLNCSPLKMHRKHATSKLMCYECALGALIIEFKKTDF